MSKRTFIMGTNTKGIEKMEATRQAIISGILNNERAEELGVTAEGIENCGRFSRLDQRNPTLKSGVAGPAIVRGDRFQLTDEHRNSSGETVLEGYRPVGGGRFEKVRIVEAQATQHTRIVSRVLGGR